MKQPNKTVYVVPVAIVLVVLINIVTTVIGCKTFFALMDYDEKPEASKCSVCRRRGRDNYHNKRMRQVEKEALEAKKNCQRTISPQGFCSIVNSMTKEEDEVIDIQTLIEFATHENDDRECESFAPETETMQQNFPCIENDDFSMLNSCLDDEELTDIFKCCSDVPGTQIFPNFN